MTQIDEEQGLVAGRECGSCAMCCKVFPVPETGKEPYGNCPNLNAGGGCSIYETRPQTCRDFFCTWRLDASLDDAWKPCNAGFVLHDPPPWALMASHDIDDPDAWRRPPFEGQIREWALELGRTHQLVGIRVGDQTRLLLKDREVDIDLGGAKPL